MDTRREFQKPKSTQNRVRRKIPLIIFGLVVGFLTWLFISVLTMETSLDLTTLYTLPDSENFDNLYDIGYGEYAVAIDGQIVAGRNYDQKVPTASTAKMILSLAVMQEKPFLLGESGEDIEITQDYYDKYVWYYNNGGSVSEVEVGEIISEYDALTSTLIVSSNNMADTLAVWAFGSIDNYRDYSMNMLNEWGINTVTIGADASGFDDSTTATAEDLAKIGTKILENPVLREIVSLEEYTIPVAGKLENTNKLIGKNRISGIKTGYIGDASGYCLISGYFENDDHIVTLSLLGAPSRYQSFSDSLALIYQIQNNLSPKKVLSSGDIVGQYDSWWTGKVNIISDEDLELINWSDAISEVNLEMEGGSGLLKIMVSGHEYSVKVSAESYNDKPSLIEKIQHVFGWSKNAKDDVMEQPEHITDSEDMKDMEPDEIALSRITDAQSSNCTIKLGYLMLINPNFMVEDDFIATRRSELVSISSLYGIVEGNPGNGDNLLDAEAAAHINDMVKSYEAEYPGHTLETRSCFRSVGTKCGRLCAATGASDHHTGLTCDLIDPVYGTSLDTDTYDQHIDWQWLKANSYKYGFIDRFPEAWAGGPMSEPINVDDNGSTGLYETWHYRYVGNPAATEIATGKYNNGEYDSLEHYLKARGLVTGLKTGTCE